MDIKFQLPNPDDCSVEEFFSQIRISITAAEKSYQNYLKNQSPEDAERMVKDKNPWISFSYGHEVDKAIEDAGLDDRQDQEVYLSICEG